MNGNRENENETDEFTAYTDRMNNFALSAHSIGAGVHSTKGTRKEETRERENKQKEATTTTKNQKE